MSDTSGASARGARTGQVIRGMYRLGRVIGKGGMGEIYEAEHVSIPRRFAVKILRGDYADDADALKRFHREATIAASVGSAHIVEVFDFNQAEDGSLYMAMELLEGESLTSYMRRVGPMDPWRWLALLTQIGSGLYAAHLAEVVHRDLKPDNLFLARNARGDEILKILDFGISKIKTTETMQTQAGAILGTPNYMSPEQAEGEAMSVDARADLFSLGAITYEALSGQMAFGGPSLPAVFMKICFEEPTPLAEIAPQLPPGVIDAVNRALCKDPAGRFESVRAFAEAFRAGLESSDVAPSLGASAGSGSYSGGVVASGSYADTPQTTLSGAAAQAALPELPSPPARSWAVPVVVGVVGLILVAGIATLVLRRSGSPDASGPGDAKPAQAPASPEPGSAASGARVAEPPTRLDAGAPMLAPAAVTPKAQAGPSVAMRPRPMAVPPRRRRVWRVPLRRRATSPPRWRRQRDRDIAD